MKPNNKWLSISLFCKKHHWPDLMQNGILPHINKLRHEGRVKNYCLEFNGSNGDNIRLTLLVPASNASTVARETGDHFTAYLSTLPVTENKKEADARKLFMDFPDNTIQYGLYTVDNGDPALQQGLSEIIITALFTEAKDDTIIIRLAFYLYITLLQVASGNTGLSFKQLLTMEYCFYTDLGETGDAVIMKQFFAENRHMLFETSYTIMKLRGGLPEWVYQWAGLCEIKFKNHPVYNNSSIAAKAVFDTIAGYIDKQINLSANTRILLFHFIRQLTAV